MPRRGFVVLLLSLALTVAIWTPATAEGIATTPFYRVWHRTDGPVADLKVSRTWVWGPAGFSGPLIEPYAEAPGGQRQVQYFDKSRMEINDPAADQNSDWYVTNGLLAEELMTGRMQLGDNTFQQFAPALVNVAGDSGIPNGPTYASLAPLMSAPPLPMNTIVTQTVTIAGHVNDDPALAAYGVVTAYHLVVSGIDHTIASPFWAFMNSSGSIYPDAQSNTLATGLLSPDPFYITGYPLTEPYWAQVLVGGVSRQVLIQCFERRCLTYTPSNPSGWQVEFGNVGQHYYQWRYGQLGQTPDTGWPNGATARCVDGTYTYQTGDNLCADHGFIAQLAP